MSPSEKVWGKGSGRESINLFTWWWSINLSGLTEFECKLTPALRRDTTGVLSLRFSHYVLSENLLSFKVCKKIHLGLERSHL